MTQTRVFMDNCGFQTMIEAESTDDGKVKLKISSNCKGVQEFAGELQLIDPMELIGQKIGNSVVHQAARECLRHIGCVVPTAIIRTIEVEAGFALPGKSSISIEKT